MAAAFSTLLMVLLFVGCPIQSAESASRMYLLNLCWLIRNWVLRVTGLSKSEQIRGTALIWDAYLGLYGGIHEVHERCLLIAQQIIEVVKITRLSKLSRRFSIVRGKWIKF